MNRRISATDASTTTYFHYDGASPNVIAETDGAGGTIATYARDASGRLVAMTRGGATYYYHVNGHGDVVALTDVSGTVVDSYRYDPWGRVLSASETVANPYRYAGYRYDSASGLYYLWNRYYSSASCRFLTKDLISGTVAAPVTMNSYVYCKDLPTGLTDPAGLIFGIDDAVVITVVIAAMAISEYVVPMLEDAAPAVEDISPIAAEVQGGIGPVLQGQQACSRPFRSCPRRGPAGRW